MNLPVLKSLDISVVILCYKAGENIVPFVVEMKNILEERKLSYELVLVANYNKGEELLDATPAVVRKLAQNDPTMVVVSKEKEGMFGWDVRSGLGSASGKTIAFIDGDGQMPAPDVVRVYEAMIKEEADMAQTFRVKRHDSLERVFISRVYNFLLKLLFPRVAVYDANSKPKIFTRRVLEKLDLHASDWFVDAEIIIQATKFNFKIIQLPTVFLKNKHRSSFVKFSTLFEFLVNLLYYRLFGRVR